MKRSDIATSDVLAAVTQRNLCGDLFSRFPPNLVYAALERDLRKGFIDYGVSLRGAWLTPQGRSYVQEGAP